MSSRSRFIIFITVIIGFVLLLSVVFGGGKKDDKPKTAKPTAKATVLTDYADRDSRAFFTYDGRITSDQDHRAIRMTVSASQNKIEIIQGYQNNVIESRTYPSNNEAYRTFLRSAALFGMDKKRTTNQTDDRGVCPLSYRYIVGVQEGSNQAFRLWSADCQKGTLGGNTQSLLTLFRQQIPDYDEIVGRVQL